MATREVNVKLEVGRVKEFVAKLEAAHRIIADRERELLELKGPCSNKACRLHYAHSGPCDTREVSE